ncbi:MAG: hypothetical protein ACXAEN_12305 [Candidatus Thorarchaeota archaeon]|jgi:hypothetical protein
MNPQAIRAVLREVDEVLLQLPNVVAVSIGYKEKGGQLTDELCIICSVHNKVPLAKLSLSEVIPQEVGGVKTDVQRTGEFRAQTDPGRYRPAPGGVSIGHHLITAGTLGCLVQRGEEIFILSNNHVLANANEANLNDPIWQPGRYDGGSSSDTIATLAQFVPIVWEGSDANGGCSIAKSTEAFLNYMANLVGSRYRTKITQQAASNKVDAAIARPLEISLVKNSVRDIGIPASVQEAEIGMQVQKTGRTTGHTKGTVASIFATVSVTYGGGKTALFKDQILTTNMSQGGDSGSALFDMDRHLIGLLYAGSEERTIHNRIQNVMAALNIDGPIS